MVRATQSVTDWITFTSPSSSTAMKFHLTILAIAFNIANSAPNGLVRRLGDGFESIVVYAVPTPPVVSDQSYSSSSIGQNYYSPSSVPSYSSTSSSSSYSSPSSPPSYSTSSSGQNYYSPSYSAPSYTSPSSDPIDAPYNTATFCRHKVHSTPQRNYRQREQITHQPVRETFTSRNNYPYSSYGTEKTAHPTPNYSVRESFKSTHRQTNYGRDNSRFSEAPMYGQTGLSYEAFTIHQKFPTSRIVMGYRLLPSSMRR